MKGTKTKQSAGAKTTSKTGPTASGQGQRQPTTASKAHPTLFMTLTVLFYRQELKRSLSEEIANLHEELRLQR